MSVFIVPYHVRRSYLPQNIVSLYIIDRKSNFTEIRFTGIQSRYNSVIIPVNSCLPEKVTMRGGLEN